MTVDGKERDIGKKAYFFNVDISRSIIRFDAYMCIVYSVLCVCEIVHLCICAS